MMMNELAQKENNILQTMASGEITPIKYDSGILTQTYCKMPLSQISALGVGFEPMANAIQQIANGGQAVSGLYRVTIPAGTHLAQFSGSSDFLGTALSDSTNTIANQAHLSPIAFNPTTMFAAATLANINKKLDIIQETQQEMMNYIVQKEKSSIKGDLDFLVDVFNNYKHNWNSDKYKTANHIKALDIRQESNKRIDFYREQIKKHIDKKDIIHSDQNVKKQLQQVQDEFKDYQLSLYLFSFAYFLEVLLQENYDSSYLSSISNKIDGLAIEYRELYSKAYSILEDRTKTSLQSKMIKGLSGASKFVGKTVASIPHIRDSQLDENLIEAGERLSDFSGRREQETLQQLVDRQSSCVRPFIEQIDTINVMYNKDMTVLFDKETLYIGMIEE
ncbi:MAG: hypothetical protein LUH03_01495 [Oscillospiraceae bacterium]|nr:hypothetical protein [Oscillospiraceae bacterium]